MMCLTGEWRRLYKKGLYALYSSPNTFRVIKSGRLGRTGNVARMWDTRGAYSFGGEPEGRRQLERTRRRWKDNTSIKTYIRQVEWRAWTGSIWRWIGTGGGLL
jgi:hypothetical protein